MGWGLKPVLQAPNLTLIFCSGSQHLACVWGSLMALLVGNMCIIGANLITNGTIGKQIGANGKNGNAIGTNVTNQWNPEHTRS